MGIYLWGLTFNFSSGAHSLFPDILTGKGQDVGDEFESFPAACKQLSIDVLLTVHLSLFILVIIQPVNRTATYRCDDTRDCIIQF